MNIFFNKVISILLLLNLTRPVICSDCIWALRPKATSENGTVTQGLLRTFTEVDEQGEKRTETPADEKSGEINSDSREVISLESIFNDRKKYGNKAVKLHRLIELELPVPPGFVISTEVLKGEGIPSVKIVRPAIQKLEKETGKKFGDANNPLYLSVRSSPSHSMPGLLTTELYITTEDRLIEAIQTVRDSWDSEAAQRYRNLHDIPDDLGTAVVIQAMVFGNLNENSASGVMFTKDPILGEDEISGRYAIKAEGREIVSRSDIKMESIDFYLERKFPRVYSQFITIKDILEKEFKHVQEVEFVIEDGKLWILQTRDAVLSPRARAQAALSLTRRGIISQFQMLEIFEKASTKKIFKLTGSDEYTYFNTIAKGETFSPGVALGPVAFSLDKAREFARLGKPAILIALQRTEDIQPAILSGEMAGIITQYGHEALHETVLARTQGIPMIGGELIGFTREDVNIRGWARPEIKGDILVSGDCRIAEGTEIIMDANSGNIWLKQTPPPVVEDRVVKIEGLDFDYQEEEKIAKAQFKPYDYDALVLLHAGMIRSIYTSQQITKETLRLNLAAHVIHKLIAEKGASLDKTPQDVKRDLSEAYVTAKNYRLEDEFRIMPSQDIVQELGIYDIYVSDIGIRVDFLPFGYSGEKKEEIFL